jgi:hypothetical protein
VGSAPSFEHRQCQCVPSASECLVQEHVKKYKTGAAVLKVLEGLHPTCFASPRLQPDDVDHDMHELLMDCIAVGNVEECLSQNAYLNYWTSLLKRCVGITGV